MSFDSSITEGDSTEESTSQPEQEQVEQVQEPEAQERMYTQRDYDSQFARARRSWEREAQLRREAELVALRDEYEQRLSQYQEQQYQQPEPEQYQPEQGIDPNVAAAIGDAMRSEISSRLAPYQQNLAFQTAEVEMKAKHPDYAAHRDEVLAHAQQQGISTLEGAYRSWKYDELTRDRAQVERDAVSKFLKRKTGQSVRTPAVESRGGGAPSSKQGFKDRDAMDEAAIQMFRDSQD